MFGPLDRRHTIPLQILIQTQAGTSLYGLDTVQIDMIEGQAATVSMHDGKGWAADVGRGVDVKPLGQSADKKGFAGPEFADEADHVSRIGQSSYRLPQCVRLLRRGRAIHGHRGFHTHVWGMERETA